MTTLLRAQPVVELPALERGQHLRVEDWDGPASVIVTGWDPPGEREQWVSGRTGAGPCRLRLYVPCAVLEPK